MHTCIPTPSSLSIPFHSLERNKIEDSGATALADALRVNQSLKALKYVTILAPYRPIKHGMVLLAFLGNIGHCVDWYTIVTV